MVRSSKQLRTVRVIGSRKFKQFRRCRTAPIKFGQHQGVKRVVYGGAIFAKMILSSEHPQSGLQLRHTGYGDLRRYALAPGSELLCTPVPASVCGLASTSTIPRDRPPNCEGASVGERPYLSHRR